MFNLSWAMGHTGFFGIVIVWLWSATKGLHGHSATLLLPPVVGKRMERMEGKNRWVGIRAVELNSKQREQ